MASDLRQQILDYLAENEKIGDSRDWCQTRNLEHEQFVGAVNSLQAKEMIESSFTSITGNGLKDEGKEFTLYGSYEYRIYAAVPEGDGISRDELKNIVGDNVLKIGLNYCMKDKWLVLDKASGKLKRIKENVEDVVAQKLRNIESLSENDIKDLKRRQLIAPIQILNYTVIKGGKFSTNIPVVAADITAEMLLSGAWKNTEFRELNLGKGVIGKPPNGGNLHTLLKVRSSIKEIFLELGFEEMPTNNYVESSFWNFDSLFQPQQHPARDAHDTFFIKDPALTVNYPEEYLQKVKKMHEEGGNGSIGWRYDWSLLESQKNILRTHTTAVSARMLYKLAQEPVFTPKKYFSIDKVFRNETLDATHLAEFHQIEGLVADYDLTLGNLMGIIKVFFEKMGLTNIKFKPAYNPYTEPSMEIFSYHEGHKRWLEIGNSGVFRPEMLSPMGLPEGVRVIAWGLSLERPTMIKYKFGNIRDLVGHKVDINAVQKNRICRRELNS